MHFVQFLAKHLLVIIASNYSFSLIDTEPPDAEVVRSSPNNIDRVNAITEENLKQGKII